MKGVPCEFVAEGPALSGCSAHPSPPPPVVPRAPAADVDVDEVDVEGQSCGLCGIDDRAVQQAATWTDRKKVTTCSEKGCRETKQKKPLTPLKHKTNRNLSGFGI